MVLMGKWKGGGWWYGPSKSSAILEREGAA